MKIETGRQTSGKTTCWPIFYSKHPNGSSQALQVQEVQPLLLQRQRHSHNHLADMQLTLMNITQKETMQQQLEQCSHWRQVDWAAAGVHCFHLDCRDGWGGGAETVTPTAEWNSWILRVLKWSGQDVWNPTKGLDSQAPGPTLNGDPPNSSNPSLNPRVREQSWLWVH
jgi:hypothetical protein